VEGLRADFGSALLHYIQSLQRAAGISASRQPISSNGIVGRKDLDARFRTGLSLWQGEYRVHYGQWLRWYDAQGNWVPTEAEMVQRSEQRKLSAQRSYQINARG